MKLFPPPLTRLPPEKAVKDMMVFLWLAFICVLLTLFVSLAIFVYPALVFSARTVAHLFNPAIKQHRLFKRYRIFSIILASFSVLLFLMYLLVMQA